MLRSLGPRQRAALAALRLHGGAWHRGCGWTWLCASDLAATLDALARRGLVRRQRYRTRAGFKTVYRTR